MMTMRNCLSSMLLFVTVIASPTLTKLATFDGAKGTTYKWQEVNDPVMGGRSSATFTTDKQHQIGIFNGTVRIVPSLQAPGFCNVETMDTLVKFNDVSAYSHLEMKLRCTTPFYGFKVSFAANTLDPQFKSFKADFNISSSGQWETVTIPFNAFSNQWSPSTGEPTKTCAADPKVCPTASDLKSIEQLGMWAEGAKGDFHLEIEYIGASNGNGHVANNILKRKEVSTHQEDNSPPVTWTNACTGKVQKKLMYNCSGHQADVPGPHPPTETLPDAICCDPNYAPYAEPSLFFERPDIALFSKLQANVTTFYDSVCGIPLFTAPINRTVADWQAESHEHGWPSFRQQEIHMGNVLIKENGEVVSSCGTHLGSNLPDAGGNRYCLDLVCISGVSSGN